MKDNEDNSKRLLHSIQLRNFLSFGPETPALELKNLNMLIGPNGSGKSNLIEALVLLQQSSTNLRDVILRGGGVREWIWKGDESKEASVEVIVENPRGSQPIRHVLAFRAAGQSFRLHDERIENEEATLSEKGPYFYYKYQDGYPIINVKGEKGSSKVVERNLEHEEVEADSSILAQRKDPVTYPEITYLGNAYSKIAIYREWAFGRDSIFREPQKADMPNTRLREDFSNLGLVLNRLRGKPAAKRTILEGMRDFYADFDEFDISVEGGTVQVFFTEGDFIIPATRLSDGTLRYLCLLAILCDPEPPPLICIEEPELGLHPDILPKLAHYLRAASERTQLIVTTHSDVLVDAMTEHVEVMVVCEKHNGKTEMVRLETEKLKSWLQDYTLGELWTKGELGGNRW